MYVPPRGRQTAHMPPCSCIYILASLYVGRGKEPTHVEGLAIDAIIRGLCAKLQYGVLRKDDTDLYATSDDLKGNIRVELAPRTGFQTLDTPRIILVNHNEGKWLNI